MSGAQKMISTFVRIAHCVNVGLLAVLEITLAVTPPTATLSRPVA